MAKDIEQLSIKIDANAQGASQALNDLIKQVGDLSKALSGFDASQLINQLGQIQKVTNGIDAKGLSSQINNLASSTAKYQRALGSSNTSMASARRLFNGFGNALSKVNGWCNKAIGGLYRFATGARKASKETKNFAQTVGLLYARFFLLIRGVKSLTSMVKSSMDYIEILHYFDASFGEVAKKSVGNWEQAGYDSAQAYYDSFSERAKKVTADMTGFYPEENGQLTPTGMASLGMNPSQLMQYQTMFAQMSSSMGVTSEQALYLSEALSKMGADLASVRNMEFEDVWQDMASGLVGMSRTLDKYGVNIRNSNMEMKLHELGINANVSALSQADKALLRTIILLDSSKYAWGDLAKTLDTPANQFRMLSNNIRLLGQMIGNVLLPIVTKILPYLNAFVIVLQRLFSWLAKVLGIDLSKLTDMGSGGKDNSGLSDLLDDAEGLGDKLDDDTDSAKKLKRQLQGFDALNNLTTNDDASKLNSKLDGLTSGLLNDAFMNAVSDYLKAWDDAFKELENKAQKLADAMQKFLLDLLEPVIKAWQKVGSLVVAAWKKAFKSVGRMLRDIARDFWKVWKQEATQKIFENIFMIIKYIGDTVSALANRFREAWNKNEVGLHILEKIRDIILIITEHFKNMAEATAEWAKHIDFYPLLSSYDNMLEKLKPAMDTLYGILEDFYTKVLLPLGKWVLEDGLPSLLDVIAGFLDKIDWDKLRARLSEFWEHLEPFAEKVGEGLIIFVERISDAIARFVNSETFENFLTKIEEWMDNTSAEDIADTFETIVKWIIGLKGALVAFGAIKGLASIITALKTIISVFTGGGMIAGGAGASGGTGILGTLASLTTLLTANAAIWSFTSDSFFDLSEAITGTDFSKAKEKYSGFFGFFKAMFDSITHIDDMVTGKFVGYGEITETGDVLANAFENIANGARYSEKELENFKKEYGLLEEDVESIRQAMIDDSLTGYNKLWDGLYRIAESEGQTLEEFYESFMNGTSGFDFGDRQAEMEQIFTQLMGGQEEWIAKADERSAVAVLSLTEGINQYLEQKNHAKEMMDTIFGHDEVNEEASNAGKTIASQFATALGEEIANRSTNFEEDGFAVTDHMRKGLDRGYMDWMKTVDGTLNETESKVVNKSADMMKAGATMGASLVEGIDSSTQNIVANMGKLASDIVAPLSNKVGEFSKIGQNLMAGLNSGLNSYKSVITSGMTGFASGLVNSISRVWRIHSPSRVMMDIGGYFMEGLQVGMEDMYTPIENSMSQFANGLVTMPDFNEQLDMSNNQMQVQSSATYNADNSDTNALLRIQNSLLEAILEKDTGISESSVFKAVQNQATSYEKMYGRKAFV